MMGVLQVSFLSLITLTELNPCFSALSSLWLVDGFNSLTQKNCLEDELSPEQSKGINLFSQFLENYNFTMALVFVPMLVALIALILLKIPAVRRDKER